MSRCNRVVAYGLHCGQTDAIYLKLHCLLLLSHTHLWFVHCACIPKISSADRTAMEAAFWDERYGVDEFAYGKVIWLGFL